jgi:drug/metabolite transporter (DMT)-like permease
VLWLLLEDVSVNRPIDIAWWSGVAWFAVAGILAMAFGRTMLYASIRYLGVTRSSSVKRLNPFFSVLLAYFFLAEPITGLDGAGILAIAAAFGLLMHKSSNVAHADRISEDIPSVYYLWGVGAALAYAFAYIARKYGVMNLDAPVFGTMISAISGFVFFLFAAAFSKSHKDNLLNMFNNLNRWLVLAGIFASSGQILMFSALTYEKVSTVVMINSLEIFVASFLAVVVFRTERRPDRKTVIAAVLATAGVIAVAAG